MTNEKLQTVADEILETVDGTFYLDEPDSYRALSVEDQATVMSLVYDEADTCDVCGWWFSNLSLEQTDEGEAMCWNCYDTYEEEKREEENEIQIDG
jgi:formylmethanofuran dehydrogenase subunit E